MVVGVGWWWVVVMVVESDFSVKLWPKPSCTIVSSLVFPTQREQVQGTFRCMNADIEVREVLVSKV